MHHPAIERGESTRDVNEDRHDLCFRHCPARHSEDGTQRRVRLRHGDEPCVGGFPGFEDRHHVRHAGEFLEEEFAIGSGLLRDELDHPNSAVLCLGLKHAAEAGRIADRRPDRPPLSEHQFPRHSRTPQSRNVHGALATGPDG